MFILSSPMLVVERSPVGLNSRCLCMAGTEFGDVGGYRRC